MSTKYEIFVRTKQFNKLESRVEKVESSLEKVESSLDLTSKSVKYFLFFCLINVKKKHSGK